MSNVIEFLLTAKNKMSKPVGVARGAINGLSKSVFSLKGALVGLGAGVVIKQFIDAADTTERLQVRLNSLFGSVEEGSQLFKDMSDFAGQVPFEFEQIMEGSTRLSTVLKGGADEVRQLMPAIADVAAASGLTIQETSDQFARAYSAGLGAADLFRDRGVRDLLQLSATAKQTGNDFKNAFINAATNATSKVKGAANALATTWTGIMSMIQDKWFNIRTTIMDAGVMTFLKAVATTIDNDMGKALDNVKKNAKSWAEVVINSAFNIIDVIGQIADTIKGIRFAIAVANTAFRGLAFLFLEGWNKISKAYIAFRQLLDEDYKAPTALVVLDQASKEAAKELSEAKIAMDDLATSPMPSDEIESFKERVKQNMEQIKLASEDAANTLARAQSPGNAQADEEAKTAMEKNAERNRIAVAEDRENLKQHITDLSESFLEEGELLQIKYEEDLLKLENAHVLELIEDDIYHSLKEEAEERHQAKMAATRKNAIAGSFAFAQAIRKKDLKGLLESGNAMLSELSKTSKTAFKIQKGVALAKAIATLPSAVMQSYDNGGGYPWGLIPAGLMLATGLAQINKIRSAKFTGQAHAGLTNVPREGTFLLQRGERVVQPEQNRDLTDFLANRGAQVAGDEGAGAVNIENLNIDVNVPESLQEMKPSELQEMLAEKFIPALNALSNRGVVQDAILQAEDV